MCGISGLVLQQTEVVQERQLEKMLSTLNLRGPDAQGIYLQHHIGLGHRRLKVIDLSDSANQPMQSQDGKVVLVFNGEIYNYKELRLKLENEWGRCFITHSDTEVILQLYEVYGAEAFIQLNGMFAFAILDNRAPESVIYLVRDHFGIKPLFYSTSNGRLAFASELKPLMTIDWISKELNRDSIFSFLKYSHVPQPLSIFKAVEQVEPGTFLKFAAGVAQRVQYFDPRTLVSTVKRQDLNESEWLDALEQCFKNVLKRQLVSDVPIGTFLSGGVDSSLITILGSEVLGRPMDTFTIAYNEKAFDESIFANEVAQHVGARHHEIKVNAKDMLRLIPDLPLYFDQPFADPTLLPSLILAKESRKSITVSLSGDGGDELFFGYSYQRALNSLKEVRRIPLGIRKILLEILAVPAVFLNPRKHEQWLKLNDILKFRNDTELLQYFIGTIGPVHLDRLQSLVKNYTAHSLLPMNQLVEHNSDLSWKKQIDQVFLRTFMTDTVLAKTDRTGMAFGLEGRVPFLDDEMVQFSATLPDEYKFKNGQSKFILRKLLEKKIPGKLASRKKQGFSIPLREWLKTDLKSLLDDLLDPTKIRSQEIFNEQEILQLVKEYQSGKANHSHLLFSLVIFQLWKEHYKV